MPALHSHSTHDEETLRRHREMFRRRQQEIERADGKSERELVNTANNPAVFRRPVQKDSQQTEESESS